MIRRHGAVLRVLLMLGDAFVAVSVLLTVLRVRYGPTWDQEWSRLFNPPWIAVLIYALGWVLLLYLVGQYRLRASWSLRSEIRGISRASIWMALASFTILFLTDETDVSRVFLLLLFPIQATATIGTRAALRWWFRRYRARGNNLRNVLILGTGSRAIAFARQMEEHTALGLKVIGFLGDDPDTVPDNWLYLGPLTSLMQVLHSQVVDEVALCISMGDIGLVESIAQVCSDEGKIVRIPLEVPQFETAKRFVEDLDGTAVLSLVQGPDRTLALAVKRLLDIAIGAVALIVFSPVLLTTALYIQLRDGSPVIFRQVRLGVNGRPFVIYKFRTMVKDAEEQYATVAVLSDTKGAAFKMAEDPRVTSWGRFLRKTSIDELPQLWNVLRGDMSVVGPRPAPPREVDQYDLWHRRRLSMRPGITGLWQISSRLDEDFDQRARLDLDYIDRWSLLLDAKIVAKTVPALMRSEGR